MTEHILMTLSVLVVAALALALVLVLVLTVYKKTPPASLEAGGVILWRRPTFAGPIDQLSSAQQCFTSVFGMGTGGATVP